MTKNSLVIIILAILGNYEDLLKGPLGPTIIYFLELYVLLLNIVQSRPIPRFFINPLIRYKKKKKQVINQTILLIFAIFAFFAIFAIFLLLKTCGPPGEIDENKSTRIVAFILLNKF